MIAGDLIQTLVTNDTFKKLAQPAGPALCRLRPVTSGPNCNKDNSLWRFGISALHYLCKNTSSLYKIIHALSRKKQALAQAVQMGTIGYTSNRS